MTRIISSFHSPVGIILIEVNGEMITSLVFEKEKTPTSPEGIIDDGNSLIKNCKQQLTAYFNGTRREFDLPIQQNGTAFQQKIWTALQQIPYAKTISYLELSKRTGDIKAIRAVGTTNEKNQLSIVVPCHRVIGSNGDLTGYSGGLWRKKWLLEHEEKFAYGVQTLF
jgi:methylated-DNA-[protein]-cysteine S-methyltransferase